MYLRNCLTGAFNKIVFGDYVHDRVAMGYTGAEDSQCVKGG